MAKRKSNVKNVSGSGGARSAARGLAPSKKPIFVFVVLFAVLLVGFYAITFIPYLNKTLLPGLQVVNAKASAAIMNVFGEGASVQDTTIRSTRYSVNIAHGCDAIEPIALFAAAVLAFPVAFRMKWAGLLIGIAALCILNLFRIISLFYTGAFWPSMFETLHIDIWQPAFVVLSLFFWVVWALWATRPPEKVAHAAA